MANTDNLGVVHFAYSKVPPVRSVTIATIQTPPKTPSDLVDLDNVTLTSDRGPAPLTVTLIESGTVLTAAALNNQVFFDGVDQILVANQFFEITNVAADGLGFLYYKHEFPRGSLENVSILDLDGNTLPSTYAMADNFLFHSMDGSPYWVEYYTDGILHKELLRYTPVLSRDSKTSDATYIMSAGGLLTLPTKLYYSLRFLDQNGYQLLPPYGAPLNDPWYVRVRFNLRPVVREYANQPFTPNLPYLTATWVPGKVLASDVIEFERPFVLFADQVYPDILVYDKNYTLKYALDGSDPTGLNRKGYLYPWMKAQFLGIDETHARVHVAVALAPDDIPLAFYTYAEKDLIYRAIDLNPYSNPAVKNKIIEFYFADRTKEPEES
jgi:hypothetical protein